MRLNAYVLAGDPAWVEQSIASYYEHVSKIVVSYDSSKRSWSGAPLSVDEALQRISAVDPDGKVVLLPGDHVGTTGEHILTVETAQRQRALDAASDGADWVVQLDTDEIVPSMTAFLAQLDAAAARGAQALEYPARMFYARTHDGGFLEHCGRWWTTQTGFPGPVVVAAGTRLTHARQAADAPLYRVDVSPWNRDPAHARGARVHAVVPREQAILHLSWVRTEEQMREKSVVSGYANTKDWTLSLRRWRQRAAHPRRTVALTPLVRSAFDRFRLTRLPEFDGLDP
jgi:hypothetical protein